MITRYPFIPSLSRKLIGLVELILIANVLFGEVVSIIALAFIIVLFSSPRAVPVTLVPLSARAMLSAAVALLAA